MDNQKEFAELDRKVALISEFAFDNVTNTPYKIDEPAENRKHYCPFCFLKFKAVEMIAHEHKVKLKWNNPGRDGDGAWEAHHVVPESQGGSDELDNCVILCWPCHSQTF